MYPMTLRLPLVLDDNRTTDRVEVAMAQRVEVEVTRQRAILAGADRADVIDGEPLPLAAAKTVDCGL